MNGWNESQVDHEPPPWKIVDPQWSGGISTPHLLVQWKLPFELDRIFGARNECTICMAIGTSGLLAAGFVAHVRGRTPTIHVGPEEPANAFSFAEPRLGKAGEALHELLDAWCIVTAFAS